MNFIDDNEDDGPNPRPNREKNMVEEERMENDEDKENTEMFKGFKHPFDQMDEF